METIDAYSTHLKFLEKIFSLIEKPEVILEFGMGNFSTEFFIGNSTKLISIEMQSEEWYNKMVDRFGKKENWEHYMLIGEKTYENFKLPKIDFCFVDGHGKSRPECVNLMMSLKCPIILAHDTETSSYGWDRVLKNEYLRYDFKELNPWTTLWTINESLYKLL